MNWFHKFENEVGEEFGELEKVIGHPLYFITAYRAEVSPVLTRGSWPTASVLKGLAAEGFMTVVNLCAERTQDEDVAAAGLLPKNIPIIDNTPPTDEQVKEFFDCYPAILATSKAVDKRMRIYLHCEQGKGRTGCMVAAYRVKLQGWTPAAALAEAIGLGLSFPAQKDWIQDLRP